MGPEAGGPKVRGARVEAGQEARKAEKSKKYPGGRGSVQSR